MLCLSLPENVSKSNFLFDFMSLNQDSYCCSESLPCQWLHQGIEAWNIPGC